MWTLIVFMAMYGSYTGATDFEIDGFTSEQNCRTAGDIFTRDIMAVEKTNGHDKIQYIAISCIPKK